MERKPRRGDEGDGCRHYNAFWGVALLQIICDMTDRSLEQALLLSYRLCSAPLCFINLPACFFIVVVCWLEHIRTRGPIIRAPCALGSGM